MDYHGVAFDHIVFPYNVPGLEVLQIGFLEL